MLKMYEEVNDICNHRLYNKELNGVLSDDEAGGHLSKERVSSGETDSS